MARSIQAYATELLQGLLGPAEVEKRYDWVRGDIGKSGSRGRMLPFDAVWEARRLIVEIDELQHFETVRFFDKPDRMTVSGVHRGEQRRLYDERKVRLAMDKGYTVLRIRAADLVHHGGRLAEDREGDIRYLRRRLEESGIEHR